MSIKILTRWKGPLVAAFVLASVPGISTSESGRNELVAEPLEEVSATSRLDKSPEGEGFKLAGPRYLVPEDGWPQFEHQGATLKFGAPTPTVPLDGAEREQWGKDLVTFQFDKLRDRQPLYVYYLWPRDAEKAEAAATMEAVLNAIVEAGEVSAAIGVEYDIGDAEVPIAADLYRRAAVPVKWEEASVDFIRAEYDPEIISELVKATATALPAGTYTNFGAVEHWSASARTASLEQLAPDPAIAYWKTVSKGPFTWPELTPVASFIAVNRELDVEGIKAEPILTSKGAWSAMGELDTGSAMSETQTE